MKVGYVYDPVYLEHDTGQHPENAARLEAIMSRLDESGVKERLSLIAPRAATVEEIGLVHHEDYIAYVQAVVKGGGGWLDADTVASPGSYKAALYAAGGLIRATEVVMEEKGSSVYALVRPPGHHATATQAMGFCLFNNVAIAAKHAIKKYGLERVAIIDFDVHHGNGTQDTFYDDPQVLYISTHEFPLYPGTGGMEETGIRDAKGTTVNVPMPAGSGDEQYLDVFNQIVTPVLRRFRPQFILVSAGYDGHWSDRLAMMEISVTGFAWMSGILKDLADELCEGRLVFALEGGYPLTALAASVKATFDVLLGESKIDDPLGPPQSGYKLRGFEPPDITGLIKTLKRIHKLN
jgi:acetoin utilization deacetylase AcuC-like enzyme